MLNVIDIQEELQLEDKAQIINYLLYHNYDIQFEGLFLLNKYELSDEYDENMKQTIHESDYNLRLAGKYKYYIPLDYEQFCKRYPECKKYVTPCENVSYQYTMPSKAKVMWDEDYLYELAEKMGQLENIMEALWKITEVYEDPCVLDVEEIIKILEEPFPYMDILLQYLYSLGFRISWMDCMWEYIKIPRLPNEPPIVPKGG